MCERIAVPCTNDVATTADADAKPSAISGDDRCEIAPAVHSAPVPAPAPSSALQDATEGIGGIEMEQPAGDTDCKVDRPSGTVLLEIPPESLPTLGCCLMSSLQLTTFWRQMPAMEINAIDIGILC